MSSVTRFIRQIPQATTYYSAAAILDSISNSASVYVFEFVPASGNFVGNYPPGYVIPGSTGLIDAISEAADATTPSSAVLLRDMGKTIFAEVYSSPTASTSEFAYFRQVQLIAPSAIGATQGFMGGRSGTTFGVLGAAQTPDAYTNYLTFYIPVTIAGVGLPVAATTGAYAIAGGQM